MLEVAVYYQAIVSKITLDTKYLVVTVNSVLFFVLILYVDKYLFIIQYIL